MSGSTTGDDKTMEVGHLDDDQVVTSLKIGTIELLRSHTGEFVGKTFLVRLGTADGEQRDFAFTARQFATLINGCLEVFMDAGQGVETEVRVELLLLLAETICGDGWQT